jgi:hypothetical protein
VTALIPSLPDQPGYRPRASLRLAVTTSGVLTTLLCMLLFLLLNPFLALFLLAIFALCERVPPWSFILPATISFTMFFYSREYGIAWYAGSSTDDVPTYIEMFNSDYGLTFVGLLLRFVVVPSGNEPLWHLPWWFLANAFDATDFTFVFLHYVAIFLALFVALYTLSSRFLVPFVLVYFFLAPTSVDGVAHIWRQEFASFVFLAGVGLYLVRGQKSGRWIIYLTPLLHLSSLFLVAVFLLFELLRKRRAFDNKAKVLFILIVILLAVPAASTTAVVYLDSIGLHRIMLYFEGTGVDPIRVYLLIIAYALPQLAAYWMLRNDDLNRLILMLCFAVFSIVLALPAANGIYDRLLMSTLPLWALFMFRCLLMNFTLGWRIPAVMLIFLVGSVRMYIPATNGDGPGAYLAFGHALEPTMGLLKVMTTLQKVE